METAIKFKTEDSRQFMDLLNNVGIINTDIPGKTEFEVHYTKPLMARNEKL